MRTHGVATPEKPGFQQSQRTSAAAAGSLRSSWAGPVARPEHSGGVAGWGPSPSKPGKKRGFALEKQRATPS